MTQSHPEPIYPPAWFDAVLPAVLAVVVPAVLLTYGDAPSYITMAPLLAWMFAAVAVKAWWYRRHPRANVSEVERRFSRGMLVASVLLAAVVLVSLIDT